MRSVRSIILGTGVGAALSVPLAVSVAASADSSVIISRNKPAAASSVLAPNAAARADDLSDSTRWASAAGPGTQWLRIDLGSVRSIARVQLRWAGAYAKAYRVQTSTDGANWKNLYATASGNGGVDDLSKLSGSGRYVRVLATQRGQAEGGYSLADVKAYGPASTTPLAAVAAPAGSAASGLEDGRKKEYALELVSSAENSTKSWRGEFGYIEDIGDGRGYTGGIAGFCSGTSDMLAVVNAYTKAKKSNVLARYLPALRTVDGSDSHAGLDPGFPLAWRTAAKDPVFQKVQENARDSMYFTPAVKLAKGDKLRALGQFAYFDAAVMHGVSGLQGIRAAAMKVARTPAQGGDELTYLNAFLNAREAAMRTESAHLDTTRVDTAQRVFLRNSNLDLSAPLSWKVYGDSYKIAQ
ncbi:chemotaxis protein [Actinoplanes sp. TBRC 11911]|uniref:chitosanase n=1 Tax=Actinoplanes sp. TBRC 11911 TaxID=2729386 RepID=UPI00145FB037|nr:chitosanase [Actinoplanes sp. TBRC 11911]NMO50565.1 chemotaxis protein [Actinoplanes sp. TBRC 11911]